MEDRSKDKCIYKCKHEKNICMYIKFIIVKWSEETRSRRGKENNRVWIILKKEEGTVHWKLLNNRGKGEKIRKSNRGDYTD
jgi:hypothetical protein